MEGKSDLSYSSNLLWMLNPILWCTFITLVRYLPDPFFQFFLNVAFELGRLAHRVRLIMICRRPILVQARGKIKFNCVIAGSNCVDIKFNAFVRLY